MLLAVLTMIGPLSIDTYLPSFHAIGEDFAVGAPLVQQTLSAYLFALALMMLFYGTLSDAFGRRPVILWSLAAYCLASFGAALAPSFGWLLFCRVGQGLAAGAGAVVSRAIVRDRASLADTQKILAYMTMVFSVVPVVAPVLGGWLHVAFGWRAVFAFLGLCGLAMLIAVWRALPESLPAEARQPLHLASIAQTYWRALKHPRFLLLASATAIVSVGFSLYIASAAQFVVKILGLPETAFAWMFIPLISGMMLGSVIVARFATRLAGDRAIRWGYCLMALASAWNVAYNYFFQASVPWAVLPLALYAFGLSLASPALTVMVLEIFPNNRGLASSLQAFVLEIVFALVSGLVAPQLFGSGLGLACGVAAALLLSLIPLRAGARA